MVTTRPAAPAFRWGNQPASSTCLMGAGRVFGPPCLTSSRERPDCSQGAILRHHTPRERLVSSQVAILRHHRLLASGLLVARGPSCGSRCLSAAKGILAASVVPHESSEFSGVLYPTQEPRTRDRYWHSRCSNRGNTPLRRSAGATDSPIQPALWVQGVSSDLPALPVRTAHITRTAPRETCEDFASLVAGVCP